MGGSRFRENPERLLARRRRALFAFHAGKEKIEHRDRGGKKCSKENTEKAVHIQTIRRGCNGVLRPRGL
jgi:hypothetical protein